MLHIVKLYQVGTILDMYREFFLDLQTILHEYIVFHEDFLPLD